MIEDRRALTRRRGRTAFVNMKYSVFHRVCAMTDVKYEIRMYYTAPPKVKYEICNYAGGRRARTLVDLFGQWKAPNQHLYQLPN